jgi:phosphotriesterase-related protein
VVTVRGLLDPARLGATLAHDHVLIDAFAMYGEASADYAWIIDDPALAIDELTRFRDAGGGAICDPTDIGLGRDPAALRAISEASGVHIVMGAGWYRERVYPPEIATTSTTALAASLVHELVDGVGTTGVRAGFIGEIGTGRGAITPAEERVFRAAARAHRATGAPIMTHTTHFGELALEQLDLLAEEGVAATSVIVSHLGDRPGIASILPIAERGAWLGIDNLGFVAGYASLESRADNVAALWEAGHGDRILLASDICRTDQLVAHGGAGYAGVLTRFVPLLHERRVGEDEVRTMLIDNPARAFSYPARP